jgi:2,4-dienoyl-CoA reductase-like NADH-dependent reductase (Old Yellow Enzyme family)
MYKDFPPEALSEDGIKRTISDHVAAAKMAIRAGFDGVELHGGNGYLLEQFLSSNVNKRMDKYGGSSEKRCAFVLELLEEVGKVIGLENVSLRLSPWGVYNDMSDEARWDTWSFLCKEIKRRFGGISYVSFVEPRMEEREQFIESWGKERDISLKGFKEILEGIPVISAGGWNAETCWGAVEEGRIDACAFARWFVSNPDLVERFVLLFSASNVRC